MTENSSQNNSNKIFLIATIAIVVVIGTVVAFSNFSKIDSNSDKVVATSSSSNTSKSDLVKSSSRDSETTQIQPNTDQSSTVSANNYLEYSPALLKQSGITNRVLFFKADWCPSCNSLDKEIKSELSKIPANTLILDVDYDTNQDLRTKYGVTSQHTLVLVDENGGQIKKWTGSRDLDAIIRQIY